MLLVGHQSAWKRFAIVTELAGVSHAIHAIGWMVPREIQTFGL